jgi:hypothetical protein
MDILKISTYKDVEKSQVIHHLKNEIRLIKEDSKKNNNIDLLIYVMNVVELFYSKRKMGITKEEVVRSVLDNFCTNFLDQMIPFIIEHQLLKKKTIKRGITNYFKKKNFQRRLRRL